MFRIDDPTAATSQPTPEAANTEGYFTEGSPGAGTPATNIRASWLNMVQEELASILAAAGITRAKGTNNQVNAALQKLYTPVVGTVRNLSMILAAAAATATLNADQIIVASALNGQTYALSSFSKTINLASTGAGGMDTGSAPASGYVGLYAIYNPTTGASALLATNATAAVQPSVYGGANMPSGYTASALVSVWPTNVSSTMVAGQQVDRSIAFAGGNLISTSTVQSTATTFTTTLIPKNARYMSGNLQFANTASSGMQINIYASDATVGSQSCNGTAAPGVGQITAYNDVLIGTPQLVRWASASSTGTPTFTITVSKYTI